MTSVRHRLGRGAQGGPAACRKRRAAWTNGSAVFKRNAGPGLELLPRGPRMGPHPSLAAGPGPGGAILAPFDVAVAHREGMLEIVPQAMHQGHVVKEGAVRSS